jgi:hypothetical protein
MIVGPKFVSRSVKLAAAGLSLLLMATAAIIAVAQQGRAEVPLQIPTAGAQQRTDADQPGADPNDGTTGATGATGATGTTGTTNNTDADAPTAGWVEGLVVDDASITTSRAVSGKLSVGTAGALGHVRVPVVTDWSTRHVVFANPRTAKDAARLENNTRYRMQLYRRNAAAAQNVADASGSGASLLNRFRNRVQAPHNLPATTDAVGRDWNVTLGGNGKTAPTPTVGDEQFPAKFSFDVNAPPDCTNDFVVYNTNTNLLIAFNNLYVGTNPTTGVPNGYCKNAQGTPLSVPTVMWAYNISEFSDGVTSTSVTLSIDGTQVAVVESSPKHGSVLHIIKWHAGDGTIAAPMALWEAHDVTNDPADWATNCGGSGKLGACMWTVPFAADYFYSGPAVKPAEARANFRVSPDALTKAKATDSNSAPYYDYANDIVYIGTDSANIHRFVDVFNGGTTAGPSETVNGNGLTGWPLYMDTVLNPALTGPIEDSYSGRIFVATADGYLRYVETGNGAAMPGACSGGGTAYPCLSANNFSAGTYAIPDPPVVDSSVGTVMVFQGIDGYAGTAQGETVNPGYLHAYAAQASTTSCVCGVSEVPGGAFQFADFGVAIAGGASMHSGDFDEAYYTYAGGGSVSGWMYVCAIDPLGVRGTSGGNSALRRIEFDENGILIGTPLQYLDVSTTNYDECSPVTEVYNPNALSGAGEELMFFSVKTNSVACKLPAGSKTTYNSSAPGGGCLMSFQVQDESGNPFTAGFAAEIPESGGTSGIVVDNISPQPQASSIYFSPLGYTKGGATNYGACTYVGCATKVTQNGLN